MHIRRFAQIDVFLSTHNLCRYALYVYNVQKNYFLILNQCRVCKYKKSIDLHTLCHLKHLFIHSFAQRRIHKVHEFCYFLFVNGKFSVHISGWQAKGKTLNDFVLSVLPYRLHNWFIVKWMNELLDPTRTLTKKRLVSYMWCTCSKIIWKMKIKSMQCNVSMTINDNRNPKSMRICVNNRKVERMKAKALFFSWVREVFYGNYLVWD